jgi:hypothetical protein
MKILILLFVVAGIWHYLYEGIIAPSIRLHLRNRLFALRDEIRDLKISGIDAADEKAFWFVHDGINNFINRLPFLTIERAKILTTEYAHNELLRKTLDEHRDAVLKTKNKGIHNVFLKTNSVIEKAFITNMGGWFIYIVPIALILAAMSKLSSFATELIVAPTKDVERLIPST